MMPSPPDLKDKTDWKTSSNNTICITKVKDEMPYHKIEANSIFDKFLQDKLSYPPVVDRNCNFSGTSSVDIILNNEDAYQLYVIKRLTYGKKSFDNYKTPPASFLKSPMHSHKSSTDHKEVPKKIEKRSSSGNTYLRAFDLIPLVQRPLFDPPCEWLEKRFYIDDMCHSNSKWEDIATVVRENLINLANDICIFFSTQSHFIVTIIKVEAYNVMRLLALPAIQDFTYKLSKKLLQNLFKLAKLEISGAGLKYQEMRDVSKDLMWNYYRFPSPHARTLKDIMRDSPKIVYYSSWIQDKFIPGITKHKVDPRFVRIERKFNCKIIFRRNLTALSIGASAKVNETLLELYLDYNHGQFKLAMSNINKLIRYNDSRIYKDLKSHKIMVSCVSKEFFCCEEVTSLIEREYVMADMSYNFIQLMTWLKSQRIGYYVCG